MKVWIFSKQFLVPFSDFSMVLPTFNFPLALRTDEFGKPSSSFNVISDRALILDARLSWLAFLPNNATLWWL